MNDITHRQAIKWIHRRLDELLNENQLLSLDEHLRSCDSCRAYASKMELLPAHLQNEFHRRWDGQPGPSQNVMEHVMAKARKIPITNRISSGIKLFAGIAAVVVMVLFVNLVISQLQNTSTAAIGTETATGSLLADQRLLAFASDQNGNFDIYTMRPDGSELTNLTNNPADDFDPFWSPDGKRIAFESDRSGFIQIFVMNADGSNVIQLTHDEVDHDINLNYLNDYSPWSPDGNQLIFSQKSPGEEKQILYLINTNGENQTPLVNKPGYYENPLWSPDGKHIAFVVNEPYNTRIYTVKADGSDLKSLPEQASGLTHWSQDGRFIYVIGVGRTEEGWVAYEASVDDNKLQEKATSSLIMMDWWDSTSFARNAGGSFFTWLRSDGTHSTLETYEECPTDQGGSAYRRSSQGSLVIVVYCHKSEIWLYFANSDGTVIKQLLAVPIIAKDISNIRWSPDDQFIAFNIVSSDKTKMYILDVDEALANPSIQPVQISVSNSEYYGIPSWRPTVNSDIVEQKPTPVKTPLPSPKADNRLIAFTSIGENGNLDIYTMHADGSGLTNITDNPANDVLPFWSPDGKYIAFESVRNGFMQIFLINADGTGLTPLTDTAAQYEIGTKYSNSSNPWSPDGNKLIVSRRVPGEETWMLYTIDINGENKNPLVNKPGLYSYPSWSPNGTQVAFVVHNSQTPDGVQLYVVNADGSNSREIRKLLPQEEYLDSKYYWSSDGQSIVFNTFKNDPLRQTVYELNLETNTLLQKDTPKPTVLDWRAETSLIMDVNKAGMPLIWQRSDGTNSTFDPFQGRDDPRCGLVITRSLHGNFAIGAYCPDNKFWLYWANPDGTVIKQLLTTPINVKDFPISNIAWSSDDKFIAFNIASSNNLTDMFILDIEASLTDPSIQPLKMTLGGGSPMYYNVPSWQPQP